MPRYVLLQHDHPMLHWDLMLEWQESLRTWRLAENPLDRLDNEPTFGIDAELLADHRLAYLSYEGPVSGGRGIVTQEDAGQYRVLESNSSRLHIELSGGKLECWVQWDSSAGANTWTFTAMHSRKILPRRRGDTE